MLARLRDGGRVLLRDAAQHGVGEARRPGRHRANELHALAHRDVGTGVEVDELEGGEPQGVSHARLELGPMPQVGVDQGVERFTRAVKKVVGGS